MIADHGNVGDKKPSLINYLVQIGREDDVAVAHAFYQVKRLLERPGSVLCVKIFNQQGKDVTDSNGVFNVGQLQQLIANLDHFGRISLDRLAPFHKTLNQPDALVQ